MKFIIFIILFVSVCTTNSCCQNQIFDEEDNNVFNKDSLIGIVLEYAGLDEINNYSKSNTIVKNISLKQNEYDTCLFSVLNNKDAWAVEINDLTIEHFLADSASIELTLDFKVYIDPETKSLLKIIASSSKKENSSINDPWLNLREEPYCSHLVSVSFPTFIPKINLLDALLIDWKRNGVSNEFIVAYQISYKWIGEEPGLVWMNDELKSVWCIVTKGFDSSSKFIGLREQEDVVKPFIRSSIINSETGELIITKLQIKNSIDHK